MEDEPRLKMDEAASSERPKPSGVTPFPKRPTSSAELGRTDPNVRRAEYKRSAERETRQSTWSDGSRLEPLPKPDHTPTCMVDPCPTAQGLRPSEPSC